MGKREIDDIYNTSTGHLLLILSSTTFFGVLYQVMHECIGWDSTKKLFSECSNRNFILLFF